MRRAKIVCTLGPATSSESQVRALVDAGMDVARLNMSHGTHADHERSYRLIREASDATGHGVQASLLSASMQANGAYQVTYAGKPLYHFAGDAKAGDVNGQGVGDVWFVLSANGELVKDKATEKEATGGYP